MNGIDMLADARVGEEPGNYRTVGTLMFTAWFAFEFISQPETFPVFFAWYTERKRQLTGSGPHPDPITARAEIADMAKVAQLIGLSGRSL